MSLTKNFIYSSILTVSTYMFPLLVYPYVSRVLGLSYIGIVNFVDNLINYFVLISMMGIMTVGVREIAAARGDKEKLSGIFNSFLSLTAITTLIAVVVLWVAMYTLPTLIPHRQLLYIGLIKLTFNLFLIEWFFMGMEDFRYITNRSILIKCLYVACVFLFVKEPSDYKIYYVISVAMVVINALINIFYSRKFVHYSLKSVNMRPFVKTFLMIGIYVLLTNVYMMLNAVWLGFVTNTDEVGYLTTATKLHTIIMAVLTSFATILFPRMSNLLAEGKKDEFWLKINVSFDAIFVFAFPTIIFIMVAGPQLLHIIVGDGFEGAYLPLRIITPLVLVIGIEQILVIQILLSMHQDNVVLRNAVIAAVSAMVFNILLTPSMGAVGSAIVWVIAECTTLGLSAIDIYRKYRYLMPCKRILTYFLSYVPLLVLSILLYNYMTTTFISMLAVALLTIVYAGLNEVFVIKNKVVCQLLIGIYHKTTKAGNRSK